MCVCSLHQLTVSLQEQGRAPFIFSPETQLVQEQAQERLAREVSTGRPWVGTAGDSGDLRPPGHLS